MKLITHKPQETLIEVPCLRAIKYLWYIKFTLLILSILYLIQLFSPLRLNTDAVVFLSMAESFVDGHGFLYKGLPTHFPPGYPALLSFLDLIGIGYSWAFIASNLIFFFIGNAIVWYICQQQLGFNKICSYLIIIITLCSWVFIKHVTLPVSDVPFYGLSLAAIGVLSYAESAKNKERKLFFLVGIFITILAMTVRTIGITIIVALIFQTLHKNIHKSKIFTLNWLKIHILILSLLSLSFIIIIIFVINTKYFNEALQSYNNLGSFSKGILWLWVERLKEMGELSVNLSITKIPYTLKPLIPIIGLVFLGGLIYILYNRRDKYLLVDYYIFSYLLIIFLWPYKDPRFWLPILPLLTCMVAILVIKLYDYHILKLLFIAYFILFSLLGLAALGYSTRISLSGPRFHEFYGDDKKLRNVYRIFLSKDDQSKELSNNDEKLQLLRRFSNTMKQ